MQEKNDEIEKDEIDYIRLTLPPEQQITVDKEGRLVMNVFFCGTASNQTDRNENTTKYGSEGELITGLHQYIDGYEYVNYLNVDGPGSGNLQSDIAWVDQGTPNKLLGLTLGIGMKANVDYAMAVIKGEVKFINEIDDKKAKLLKKLIKKEKFKVKDSKTGKIRKLNDNEIDRIIAKRKALKITPQTLKEQYVRIKRKGKDGKKFRKVDVVNLVGWSRGGVEAFKTANAMYLDPDLKDTEVNIFAIDPVPGPFRFGADHTSLPPNVKRCTCVYAEDERLKILTPIVPEVSDQTDLKIVKMPGAHGTLIGNGNTLEANKELLVYQKKDKELQKKIEQINKKIARIKNKIKKATFTVESKISPSKNLFIFLTKLHEQLLESEKELIVIEKQREQLKTEFRSKQGHDDLKEPFYLVQDMALRFLHKCGVNLTPNAPVLSVEARKATYDSLKLRLPLFRKLRTLYSEILRGNIFKDRHMRRYKNGNVPTSLNYVAPEHPSDTVNAEHQITNQISKHKNSVNIENKSNTLEVDNYEKSQNTRSLKK